MNNEIEKEETKLDRTMGFFRKHIYNVLLVLISIAFLFKDIIKIEDTGKTLIEIIASSFLAFIFGMAFNIILGKKGIISGKNTQSFINTMIRYNAEIDKTDDYIEKLDGFCDIKNEQRIKKAQIKILRSERIKYDDFINKEMEEVCKNESQIKCWERAKKVKVQHLTPDNLLSETDERYEKGKKELTIAEYEKMQNAKDSATKIIFALIFGYFGVTFMGNIENIMWGIIQIGTWLLLAMMRYIKNYSYITDVYKSKIHRKINYLIEFNSLVRKEGNNGQKEAISRNIEQQNIITNANS